MKALDQTIKQRLEAGNDPVNHVSCRDLLEGFCELANIEFGPMATTVLKEWGIKNSYNVGEMVFQLIDAEILGKQPSDSLNDFKSYLDLHSVLSEPYLPETQKTS